MELHIIPQSSDTLQALAVVNRQTDPYGLTLTAEEMLSLVEGRVRALRDTGRVELGEGILPKLIGSLYDSPHLHQADYAGTMETLQSVFYRWKNEAGDLTPDDDILALLRRAFDRAGGSTDYLEGFSMAETIRLLREEGEHG